MMQSQILWPSEVLRPFVHHYWLMQQMEGTEFADIISQLGFTDHSHLYKEFKLFAGLSPTDYLSHLQQIRSEHLLAGYRAYHG